MARDGRKKGRGCLITLLVLVILALLVWFVGVPLVNKKAGDMVDSAIQDAISSPGMPPLEYRDIAISAQKGQVDLYGLNVPLEAGSSLQAEHIRLIVSPGELAAFGMGRSEGLTKADVELQQFSYATEEQSVSFGEAFIQLDGLINLNEPERSVIRDAQLTASDMSLSNPQSSMAFQTESISVALTGNMGAATLEKDFDGILDDIAYVDMEASNGKLVPDAAMMEQMGMFAMISPWIADTNNWGFESVAMEARSLDESVTVDTFSLAAPLMDATGSAELPRGGEGPLAVDMAVAELNPQVRAELAPIAMFMGQQIPEGSFDMQLDWSGSGMPSFTLR